MSGQWDEQKILLDVQMSRLLEILIDSRPWLCETCVRLYVGRLKPFLSKFLRLQGGTYPIHPLHHNATIKHTYCKRVFVCVSVCV